MYTSESDIAFVQLDSLEMMQFEQDVAYFFGLKEYKVVAEHYIKALTEFELLGLDTDENALEQSVLPHLENAYEEISKKSGLGFNISKASEKELDCKLLPCLL